MQLAEVLPNARLLNVADKIHVIRGLATDINDADCVSPLADPVEKRTICYAKSPPSKGDVD